MKKQIDALEARLTAAVSASVQREVRGSVEASIDSYFKSPAHGQAIQGAFASVVAPAVEKAVKSNGDKAVERTVNGIKPVLQECFRTSFQSSIIPAFETACKNMFDQVGLGLGFRVTACKILFDQVGLGLHCPWMCTSVVNALGSM